MQKPVDIGCIVRPADIEVGQIYYYQIVRPIFSKVLVKDIRKKTVEKNRTLYIIDFVDVDTNEKNWTNTMQLSNGEYDEESWLTEKLYSVDAPLSVQAA